jgi:hypothetical protein
VAGELPVGPLAAASFPKLAISGNHSPAFEAVCDALTARLKAQQAHVSGAGHARYRRCIQRNPRGIHQHNATQNSISLLNQRSTAPKTAKVEK